MTAVSQRSDDIHSGNRDADVSGITASPDLGDGNNRRPESGNSLGASEKAKPSHGSERASVPATTLLVVDAITVSFDGFKALDGLTLLIDDGELRCIIGPNGAGKSTLLDVITGKTRPDSGSVYFVGDPAELTRLDPHEIAGRGIGRKFQRPTIFPGHTVYENLELAIAGARSVWANLFAKLTGEQRDKIAEVLELIGLGDRAVTLAGLLAHGQKQWLEIGMLLVQNPRVLLVDEPVAGMSHEETERTAALLSSLAGRHTVVVVEHDMDFVRSIAKTVTVLHEGRVLAEGRMEDVQKNPNVIEVYLGQ